MQILPEPVEAVLFDWDGTLADTVALVTAATNEVLIAAGFREIDEVAVHDGMRFPTAERMVHHMGRRESDPQTSALARRLADEFYDAAERLGHLHVRLFPDVRKMLDSFAAAGLPMGLVTNNRGTTVRRLLAHLGLMGHFPVVVAEEDVSQPKPHPEGVLAAGAALGVRVRHTVYVGDSLTDEQAAARAGCTAIGAGWPRESVVHSGKNTFTVVFDRPSELVDAVLDRAARARVVRPGGEQDYHE